MPTYPKGYRDIDMDFIANPVTGDVAAVADTNSVKRGISNILMTENRERLFNPELGSGIKNLLFEPMTDLTIERLEGEITSAISAWEDRAELLEIGIVAEPDNNRYRVAVVFRIINQIEEQTLELFLQRER
jgi:phage baseplate assembly protein W